MTVMILGLLIFLGVHSVRIVADGWRSVQVKRLAELPWKAVYSIVSIIGLIMVIWGFGQTRRPPPSPPTCYRARLGRHHGDSGDRSAGLFSFCLLPACTDHRRAGDVAQRRWSSYAEVIKRCLPPPLWR